MVKKKKKVFAFDIESNALYDDITKVWCIYIFDVETGERWGYRPHQIEDGICKLTEADVLVGHNIIDFDLPALKKMYPSLIKYNFNVFDTLCLSRYLKPDRIGDSPEYPKGDPRRGPRGHGLKQWGEFLEELKGDYGEQEEAWDAFTEDMFTYCEQDVNLTVKVYLFLCELTGFDPYDPPSLYWKM